MTAAKLEVGAMKRQQAVAGIVLTAILSAAFLSHGGLPEALADSKSTRAEDITRVAESDRAFHALVEMPLRVSNERKGSDND